MFIPVSTGHQIEIVETLAREIWPGHYDPVIGEKQVDYMLDKFQSAAAIKGQIGAGALYFLIKAAQESEGEATPHYIGYLAVEPGGEDLFLSKIYVKASLRGRGYGRKAVQFAEAIARESRACKIVLTVNRNNAGSIRAYEKMGFINTGPVVKDIGGGFVMDDYRMEKNIAPR